MADTRTQPAPRRLAAGLALAAVVVAVVTGAGFAWSRGGDTPAYPVVSLTPVDHEVIYEVRGAGSSPAVTFSVPPLSRTMSG